MTCNHLTELRKQMDAMQRLLDTYEHCHVDSVTPEEKIVEATKAKCIEEIKRAQPNDTHTRRITIKAIEGI